MWDLFIQHQAIQALLDLPDCSLRRILVWPPRLRYVVVNAGLLDDLHEQCVLAHLYLSPVKGEGVWNPPFIDEVLERLPDSWAISLGHVIGCSEATLVRVYLRRLVSVKGLCDWEESVCGELVVGCISCHPCTSLTMAGEKIGHHVELLP